MAPHALPRLSQPSPAAFDQAWLTAWGEAACSGKSGALEAAWLAALANSLGASHAVLGWHEQGHTQLACHWPPELPHQPTLDTLLASALDEATDQGLCLRVDHTPAELARDKPFNPGVTRELTAALLALRAQGGTAISLPLPGDEAPLGALLLAWHVGQSPPTEAAHTLLAATRSMAPLLHMARQSQRPWHWHALQASRALVKRWRHPPDAATRRTRALALLAVAGLLCVPLPHKVGGQARIEGLQQQVLSAPTDGYIKAAHALPGDHVKQGAVLLDLAEQDLQLEREKWLSQVSQFDNAYAAAMTRGDRAEAAIGLSRLEEAQAQLALVDQQLQRAQLKAPFDGVVVQGDLSQSVGAPVKQGDTLMTVASEQGHRVIIDMDEGDIGLIHAGQRGSMALSALPWQTLSFTVRRISPQASAKEGRNVYEVEAAFDAALPAGTRPGLMGPAKVQVGHQPLAWSWLRPVIDKARLWLWAWGA